MPRLALWSGTNLTGRRILFKDGDGVAVRDLRALRFNNELSSFRLTNPGGSSNDVTLVLFSGLNFQGSFRVFRGSQTIRNLSTREFNNVTSSFVLVEGNLTSAQINRIQRLRRIPDDIVVIRQ